MKSFSVFVVGLLILSGLATLGISKEAEYQSFSIQTVCSSPELTTFSIDSIEFNELSMSESFAVLHHAGYPMLPRSVETIELPFGSTIEDISVRTGSIEVMELSQKILPAPKPLIIGYETEPVYQMADEVYNRDAYYPNDWYTITTGGGLNSDNEHVTFVTIESFPVRYNPMKDQIQYAQELIIEVKYQEPKTPLLSATDDFDLVIIAPEIFSSDLQELMDHKNSVGISTYLKTTEDIYSEYDGVDKPEQIKYFIKDAIETQDITFVMLVGGMTSPIFGVPRDDVNQGTADWHLPVRYTNNKEMGGTYDPGFISDLYYADIYEGDGNFSTWDKDRNGNSDGIFANWKFGAPTDYIDFYPDVYVGRLPCRNNKEVQYMVDKIITYETSTAGSSWYNRIIGIGGDSHNDAGTDYNEGEEVCDFVFDRFMSEFTPVKLYASHRTSDPNMVPNEEAIVREISDGAGFVLFDGHGHPGSWNTHWPGEFNWDDTPGGISCFGFFSFDNADEYPIVVVGGCHNSQINITLLGTFLRKPAMWTHGQPFAESFSWHITRKKDGGAIACMGNTGLGYGAVGNHGDLDGDGEDLPDTVEGVGGYQEVVFFKTIDEGVQYLGEAWNGAEVKYMQTYPGMEDQTDAKTLEQWPIIGDPSLKLGGYS